MICMSSNKSSKLSGSIVVPGDKSISHRALILGSLVTGKIKIKNLLESDDVIATAEALKTLGVKINKKNNFWEIFGNGIGNFFGSNFELDMGNSGTGSRLIMGLIAGSDVEATILGDESLSKRPMKRIILPLLKTGATFEDPNKNNLPIKIKGSKIPLPIEYISPVASAQIKSSILLSGLSSTGDTTVIEPSLSRDHTERMLNYLGAKVSTKQLPNSTWKITLKGLPTLKPNDIEVPSDPSSAAFPIVASIITPNSQIKVLNVCINELRTGLYTSLIEMGANIEFSNKRVINGEQIADISASYSILNGIKIPKYRVASMIDEYPILSIAAIKAKGNTIMEGVEELRYKETDRISAMCKGLNSIGVDTIDNKNCMIIKGKGPDCNLNGNISIKSNLDHRIAMSFLCLGLITENPIKVENTDTINSSFPSFLEIMNKIGAKLNHV
jgi:3-phosphoshikimate 1-carboxyvinyltransferase